MRRTSTTVYLDDDQLEDIRRLSTKLEVSQAHLIRKGIDLAINWAEERLELFTEVANKQEEK